MTAIKKPRCKLLGRDGNVYCIIGYVRVALKKAGMPERADEFSKAALTCQSYDAVLQLCFDYVTPY